MRTCYGTSALREDSRSFEGGRLLDGVWMQQPGRELRCYIETTFSKG